MVRSCYIHIPFCDKLCSYCDFSKLLINNNWIDNYLDALEKEIKETYKGERLDTIYIGGGTPSSLSIPQLERLFKILNYLNKNEDIEYTIEGNFESTTYDKLELYKKVGINRLSFGIESINKQNLEFLNRSLDKKRLEKILEYARNIGFHNINVDLIYALPYESMKLLKEDIDYILSLKVEHISTYSLIVEEHTPLSISKIKNIDENLDSDMYQLICKTLKKNHYNHYEISNFAKDGYQSRHNTTYWNNDEYYGFGLGASSYIDNKRIRNTKSLTSYLKGKRVIEEEILSIKDKIEYEILLNLRKKDGIDLIHFYKKYQKKLIELYNYEELVRDGFLIKEENKLFIPEDKWYISNEIIVRLLEKEVH